MITYLRIDKIQRFVYAGILLLWIFLGVNFLKYKYGFSPVIIDEYLFAIMVILLLIGSIVFNRKVFWGVNLIITLIHAFWTSYKIIFCALANFHSNYAQDSYWVFKDSVISISLIFISFLVSWIIWKMKPIK